MIQSRDNQRYKHLLRIVQAKRPLGGGQSQLWLEDVHLCQSWLACFGHPDGVVIDADKADTNEEINGLLEQISSLKPDILSSNLFRSLSSVQQPQGIAFVVTAPERLVSGPLVSKALLLDRVQDPGNLGTLLRTAAAADIDQVYLSAGCAAAWSQKVLRSAQGAHFSLTIFEHVELSTLIAEAQVPIFATSLSDAQSLYDTVIPDQSAWLFGNEGQGVATQLLQQADKRVFIPQSDRVESLNVAIAAGICLFEQRRQNL